MWFSLSERAHTFDPEQAIPVRAALSSRSSQDSLPRELTLGSRKRWRRQKCWELFNAVPRGVDKLTKPSILTCQRSTILWPQDAFDEAPSNQRWPCQLCLSFEHSQHIPEQLPGEWYTVGNDARGTVWWVSPFEPLAFPNKGGLLRIKPDRIFSVCWNASIKGLCSHSVCAIQSGFCNLPYNNYWALVSALDAQCWPYFDEGCMCTSARRPKDACSSSTVEGPHNLDIVYPVSAAWSALCQHGWHVRGIKRTQWAKCVSLGGESEVGATWPCLLGEFCKAVTFGGFNSNVAYHCFVWLAHSNMFHNVSKAILPDRRNTLASFSEDELHFSWQAQHFGDLHRHFAWQACRVACFPNRIVRAASSGDNVQIPLQAWLFVTCAENWRKPRTKHRFWGSEFEVHEKTCQKRRFWNYKVWKLEGVLHETPVLRLQRVPSRFFGFLVASPCLQGKLKKMTCIFRGRRNTLETSIVILRGRCRTLDVSCCGFFANCNVRAASVCKSHGRRAAPWKCFFCGMRSIWWRSAVCGVRFCVVGAILSAQCGV